MRASEGRGDDLRGVELQSRRVDAEEVVTAMGKMRKGCLIIFKNMFEVTCNVHSAFI